MINTPVRSWHVALSLALARADSDGYRYRVRADRARPGLWLVSRGARRVQVKR